MSEPAAKRPCKAGARKTPFQTKHILQYGLSITARDPQSSQVVAVRCQFCKCFGREGAAKKSSTSWSFEGPPFRTDNYTQHHRLNHKSRWEEYQNLSPEEKPKYFDVSVKHAETICHFLENRSEAMTFVVRNSIVNVVIGDMLWHEDEMTGQTRCNALSLFKLKDDGNYLIEIKQVRQFLLVTRFVSRGMSFAMAADAIQDAKDICDIPKLAVCNDYLVASYARVACAISIEHIAQISGSKWAVSVAFDASTDAQQVSWIDVRVRRRHVRDVYKAFRFNMFLWRDKLIGCSTDGADNMTGCLSGVVTRIQQVVKPNFIRVWYLLHQIDMVMQKVYKNAGCNFHKISLISFLRRQKNLVDEMQAICHNLSATRWASLSRVSRFMVEKRSEIMPYINQTNASERVSEQSTKSWWIVIAVVSEISSHVSECVEGLQGRRGDLQQQQAAVKSLLTRLQRFAFVERTPEEAHPTSQGFVTFKQWQVSHDDLIGLIQDQGIFASQALAELEPDPSAEVVQVIGEILLKIVYGLSSVEALRDEVNDASNADMPPCLPHELMTLKPRDVVQMILKYRDRLVVSLPQSSIDLNVDQYKQLLKVVDREQIIWNALGRMNEQTGFFEAWSIPGLKDRFSELMEFIGGLASPFPNTATVESDFSVLKWEKDLHRSNLTPFSLEGILHSRQIRSLLKNR